MRIGKLTAAAVGAAAVLVLPAASALAVRHPHPHPLRLIRHQAAAGCAVNLSADNPLITAGEQAQLSGTLHCGATNAKGTGVTIFERTITQRVAHPVATVTAGEGGAYSFETLPSVTSVFYAVAGGHRSLPHVVKVAPVVQLNGPVETAALSTRRGGAVQFSGTIKPAEPGALIVLQREDATSNEEWFPIQFIGTAPGGGSFSFTHRFTVPGFANIRVVVRPTSRLLARGISNTFSYVISQPQNPNLTIESTTDPAQYGQSITVHGVVKGAGAGQKVILNAKPRGKGAFAKAAETSTGPHGEYSFTFAAARNSGLQVVSGATHSANLSQGVRYVLTSTPPPASSPAGQEVTFAGKVAPEGEHAIYLERENPGGGFHAVQAAMTDKTGAFAIKRTLFGTGKQVYRIHVLGNLENMGVSSASYPIEVTPAPPGTIRPVPLGRLPQEGRL